VLTLRSTFGRIPQAGSVEPVNPWLSRALMSVTGPLTRHTEDLRLALEVMGKPSVRDPWYVPAPLAGQRMTKPIRAAVVTRPAGHELHPEIAATVWAAANALSDAGYAVEEAEPPDIGAAAALWGKLVLTDMRRSWPQMETLAAEGVKAFVADLLSVIPPADLAGYAEGFIARHAIAREWNLFCEKYPVMVGPVCTQPTFQVGEDLEGSNRIREMYESFSFTIAINVLGLPSIAVPARVVDRLPYGIQVIGPRYREDVCLEAAAAIESRLGVFTPIDPLGAASGNKDVGYLDVA
jgi:amidase